MTYEQFILALQEHIKKGVDGEVDVSIYEAVKNNGTKRKGLAFTKNGVNISPAVFLEEYYRRFQQGMEMKRIAEDVLRLYHEVKFQHAWDGSFLKDFEKVKGRIVYRLINRKANAELLQEIPYREYLDLAVIFYVLVDANDYGTASMMIRKEHLDIWHVTEEELFLEACANTSVILGEEFQAMQSVIEEITGIRQETIQNPVYVATNRIRSHGAAVILNEGFLERIEEILGESYYVLPSSIHEMIIVPGSMGPDKQELSEMVKEINETQVEQEEVLSDCAYYYDREKGKLTL